MDRNEIISCLYTAIDLAGDGGLQPFTEEEYEAMYNFLKELRNQ